MVSPCKTIQVTGQAFLEHRIESTWCQSIELAPRRDCTPLKHRGFNVVSSPKRGDYRDIYDIQFGHAHPAACSSLAREPLDCSPCPVASRPGDRFPGRFWRIPFGDASSVFVF